MSHHGPNRSGAVKCFRQCFAPAKSGRQKVHAFIGDPEFTMERRTSGTLFQQLQSLDDSPEVCFCVFKKLSSHGCNVISRNNVNREQSVRVTPNCCWILKLTIVSICICVFAVHWWHNNFNSKKQSSHSSHICAILTRKSTGCHFHNKHLCLSHYDVLELQSLKLKAIASICVCCLHWSSLSIFCPLSSSEHCSCICMYPAV